MWTFVLRRFVVLFIALVLVSVLAFLLPYMSGSDPARMIVQSRVADLAVDPETVEKMRVHLGLDRPLAIQYLDWLGNAVRGDFGLSFTSRVPVGEHIGSAIVISITLALSALAVALAVALPLGTVAALKPGRRVDNFVTFLTQSLVAIPEYWFAPFATLVFSVYLGWLPSAGWRGPEYVVLPALALALRPMAYFTRVTRAAMIDVLQAPYIIAALSRGLGMGRTVLRHGVRNAMPPVITLFALWLAGLIGGAVVVEVIFSIPGMGRLLYEAVVNKDIPMIQGAIVCLVSFSVLMSTLTDLIYVALNPAVRITDASA
jgi:peptide/nickel transport system permease protein